MKTRKQLQAENLQLREQIAAYQPESRKGLKRKLEDAREQLRKTAFELNSLKPKVQA